MLQTGTHFVLYSHNIAVKGNEKSAIYNFKKGVLNYIPNTLYDILSEMKQKQIGEILDDFTDEDDRETFEEYLAYLRESQFGFYTSNPENFVEMPLDFEAPEHITACVLEFNKEIDYRSLVSELSDLLCKDLEIRVERSNVDFRGIKRLIELLRNTTVRAICIYIEHDDTLEHNSLVKLHSDHSKIETIYVLDAPDKLIEKSNGDIDYLKYKADTVFNAAFPSDKLFVSRKFFLMAYNYHPYFYKRVEINQRGDVKNCLMHDAEFGNILTHKLTNIVKSPDFTKWWNVSNDKITDFKGNELRYTILNHQPLVETNDGHYKLN
jgi:SPASM domain peptide maturase of grasp-with-spasm system